MTKEQAEKIEWMKENWKIKVERIEESKVSKEGKELKKGEAGAVFVTFEPDNGMEILIEPDGALAK